MGEVRVGTASWTDRALIASGWYPPEARSPEGRLRYYARQFPLVEVDATYYALPAEQTAATWAARTPPGFTFNVKAFSLFTQHPTPVRALPADLREDAAAAGRERVYLKDVGPSLAEAAWQRFLAALEPLRRSGRLGAILLQFPPWFPIGRANKEYILACAERAAPRRVCVEFRNRTWMTGDNQKETLEFLSAHDLPYVCVDMPQGYPSSIPPVLAATSSLAVLRMHGHSGKWTSRNIAEKFGYRYTEQEIDRWAVRVRRLAAAAELTHVLFNNCYRDYAHVNARQLAERLGTGPAQAAADRRPGTGPGRGTEGETAPARGRLVLIVRPPGQVLPKASNSPFRTPPRNACHSSGVNDRTAPRASRLFRTPTPPPGRSATSTQLPLEKLSELLTQLRLRSGSSGASPGI